MGKINFEGLSKICDSAKTPLAQRIKDSLEATESTEEAKTVVREAIENGEDPVEVAETVVEVLGSAVDVLQEKVDAIPAAPELPVGDAKVEKLTALKKKIKDELEGTETTEDAVKVALANLEGEAPEIVLEAVTEVLAETVDALEEKVNAAPAEGEKYEEMSDEEIEDSFKALRQERLKRAKIRDNKN